MADEDLRRRERRAASGDTRDRAGLLATRLRVGVLPAGHLRCAAHLGDPAARALGLAPLGGSHDPLEGALRSGLIDPALVGAWACDCLGRVVPVWEAAARDPGRLRRALMLCRGLLRGEELSPIAVREAVVAAAANRAAEQLRVFRSSVPVALTLPFDEHLPLLEAVVGTYFCVVGRDRPGCLYDQALRASRGAARVMNRTGGRDPDDEQAWQRRRLIAYLLAPRRPRASARS